MEQAVKEVGLVIMLVAIWVTGFAAGYVVASRSARKEIEDIEFKLRKPPS